MADNFSTRLKTLRYELGLSQKEFAESVGISAMAVSTYENDSKSPSIETATKIAQKYNVSLDWLCGLSDRRQTGIVLDSMSDILDILFEIEKVTPIEIFFNEEMINQNTSETNEFPNFQPTSINEIGFTSGLLNGYIGEWNKMRKLYADKTIDDEVYSLWKEKILLQTLCTYPNGKRIIPDIPPDVK